MALIVLGCTVHPLSDQDDGQLLCNFGSVAVAV